MTGRKESHTCREHVPCAKYCARIAHLSYLGYFSHEPWEVAILTFLLGWRNRHAKLAGCHPVVQWPNLGGTQACPVLKAQHRHRSSSWPLSFCWGPNIGLWGEPSLSVGSRSLGLMVVTGADCLSEWSGNSGISLTSWCLVWFLGQRKHSIHACTMEVNEKTSHLTYGQRPYMSGFHSFPRPAFFNIGHHFFSLFLSPPVCHPYHHLKRQHRLTTKVS